MTTHRPKTWWMCLNPYHEGDKPQVRHDTFAAAQIEAARLCMKTRRKIHVLELVGTMHPPVEPNGIWEDRRAL
jgi:hypothetical protein